jgi:integrase
VALADLPHSYVSRIVPTRALQLLMAGKHPKYVQELLGHASVNITLDTYSQVIEKMDGGLADAMDDAL